MSIVVQSPPLCLPMVFTGRSLSRTVPYPLLSQFAEHSTVAHSEQVVDVGNYCVLVASSRLGTRVGHSLKE